MEDAQKGEELERLREWLSQAEPEVVILILRAARYLGMPAE